MLYTLADIHPYQLAERGLVPKNQCVFVGQIVLGRPPASSFPTFYMSQRLIMLLGILNPRILIFWPFIDLNRLPIDIGSHSSSLRKATHAGTANFCATVQRMLR
jgi:hypothetical protein